MHANTQHPATPGRHNGCGDLPCCKRLQATVAPGGKTMAKPICLDQFEAVFLPGVSLLITPQRKVSSILGTGPPGGATFAELVLQRSVRAHAPPVFLT